MKPTPTPSQMIAYLTAADNALAFAREIRERHRGHRRPGRKSEVGEALARMEEAAAPLRSVRAMLVTHDIAYAYERSVRRALADLTKERRLVRKMRPK